MEVIQQTDYKITLYRTGIIATTFMVVMIPVQIAFFLIWPHPTKIVDWFALFNENWIIGLISFDFLYMLSMIASIFLYIALFFALFDMKKDMNDLKKLVHELMEDGGAPKGSEENKQLFRKLVQESEDDFISAQNAYPGPVVVKKAEHDNIQDTEEFVEESLSLEEKEIEMIRKSLEKHNGKRKLAANELGISERTLYRKIKEYKIE